VSASSFSASHNKRDDDVRKKKFLNVAAYPEFTFRAGGSPRPRTAGP